MAAKVIHTERITQPELVLLGKTGINWGQWWSNGWFDVLEKLETAPVSPDYVGVISSDVYWIGMLFPTGTNAPEGFEVLPIPASEYALNYLYGKEDDGSLYGPAAHKLCAESMTAMSLTEKPGCVIERYNCPRFTTPDEDGNVILDYLIPIQ